MQQLNLAVSTSADTSNSMSLIMTLVLLLLAHLLGDFVLQPSRWVRQKSRSGYKSTAFWWHIVLHGVLAWLLIANFSFWPFALVLTILHGAIDQLKSEKERTFQLPTMVATAAKSKRRWFWYDQLLHLLSILLIALLWQTVSYYNGNPKILLQIILSGLSSWWSPQHILLITAAVFLTSPSAILIRNLITVWTPSYNTQLETDSLKNAGTYIGMLERLLVFTFIICGHFEAVGFLLAAKSIFRFGDLRAARDRKLTEYVLIGTLLSFGLAIFAALLFLQGRLV